LEAGLGRVRQFLKRLATDGGKVSDADSLSVFELALEDAC